MWQDEAQLANMFLEDEANRSSSESNSQSFHFNPTFRLKKNLASTFEQELEEELPKAPISERVDHERNDIVTKFSAAARSDDQSSSTRPPLPTGFTARPEPKKLKRKFDVYLRIRPLSPHSSNSDTEEKGANTIEILKASSDSRSQTSFPTTIRTYPPNLSNTYKMNINRQTRDNSAYAKEFIFDRVMGPKTSQEGVYSTVAAPLIQDLLDPSGVPSSSSTKRHRSALLFSYGITNSGKTHTILGDMNSTNQAGWGIIPRAINDIFQHNRIDSVGGNSAATAFNVSDNLNSKQKPTCNLYISFFEIYNENVFDLMPSNMSSSLKNVNFSPPALKVRECRGQIFVRGLAKHKINTTAQGIELTKQAHKKRHTSSNNLNSDSSRSHFVCQIQIVPLRQPAGPVSEQDRVAKAKVDKINSKEDVISGYSTDEEASVRSRLRSSTIWIVDLAGSERSKRTRVGSTRQKESTKINNSLVTLMRCLNAMKKDGKKGLIKNVIPFRESKLTHIFMGHLTSESAARTAMMVNVNPSVEDFDETQHVLAYARKAKLIELKLTEYGLKRKEFFGEEYDHNGRKKPRLGEKRHPPDVIVSKKSKSTLLSRIVNKLSPKKVTERKFAADETKEGNGVNSRNRDYREKIEALEKSLRAAKGKIRELEHQNKQLLNELDSKENQIRNEVSLEMEKRLRETRTKHNEKYEHLKSVMRRQASKTEISVSMNQAGIQLEELMDKIDECEKETIRMSQEHHRVLESLNSQITELSRKAKSAEKAKTDDNFKISSLEEALRKSKAEIMRLKGMQEEVCSKQRETEGVPEVTNAIEPSKFNRNLRPRKPLGNSTNQTTIGSHVFDVDAE